MVQLCYIVRELCKCLNYISVHLFHVYLYFPRFVIFDHYQIPRESLLNKSGDVTAEGKYVSPIKDSAKRQGKL